MPVGEDDRCWTVPRFHHAAKVLVERFLFLGHRVVLLPSFWNHHHDGFLQGPPGHEQEFQNVIESP